MLSTDQQEADENGEDVMRKISGFSFREKSFLVFSQLSQAFVGYREPAK